MKHKIQYLKVKFFLGFVSLVIGFIGATIALFQWVERTGVQYFFGEYSRYVLGFGGFAAMIFGALLVNDAWVLRDVLRGKYELPTSYAISASSSIYEEVKPLNKINKEAETPIHESSYKQRVVRNILRSYEFEEGIGGKLIRFFKRLIRRETS